MWCCPVVVLCEVDFRSLLESELVAWINTGRVAGGKGNSPRWPLPSLTLSLNLILARRTWG